VRIGNKIRYTNFCEQGFITERQLKVLVDFLVWQTQTAIEDKYEYYKDVREIAIPIRAKQLKMEEKEFRVMLKSPLADDGRVTFAELNFIPSAYEKSDFVPKELRLCMTDRRIYAAVWLNSGIVCYNHMASVKDYVTVKPITLGHELIHANIKLQNLILSLGVDLEAMASIPTLFEEENKIGLFFNSYGVPFRESALVFFRFDIDRARKEVIKFAFFGRARMDNQKFREYVHDVEKIQVEMRRFFREHTLPTFYADPIFWASAHERMKDDWLIFKVTMAQHYNQTILGGRVETARWLSEHQKEISTFAYKAYKKSGEAPQQHGAMQQTMLAGLRQLKFFLGIRDAERIDPEALKVLHEKENMLGLMSFDELVKFYQGILQKMRRDAP
jgi:hypothetical protein